MGIKLWGYEKKKAGSTPMELKEVTLIASPVQLRKIAKFLEAAAAGIEQRGPKWEHEHLGDTVPGFRTSPQFIVFNSQLYKA